MQIHDQEKYDLEQNSQLMQRQRKRKNSLSLSQSSNGPFLQCRNKAIFCLSQNSKIIITIFTLVLVIFVLLLRPPSPSFSGIKQEQNLLESDKQNNSLNQFQRNQLKAHEIDIENFEIAKEYLKLGLNQPSKELIQRQKNYYETKYKIQQTFETVLNKVEFRFCIVIPSYSNQENERYLLPLKTVLRQQYQNYHIVYIDDASPDGTGKLVQSFIDQNQVQQKFKLIINSQNQGPLANQYNAAMNHCKQDQIFMLIDGDDGLIGTQTLKLLNHFYQTKDAWFVYGNYIHTDNQAIGVSKKIPDLVLQKRTYRYQDYVWDWITSHPKTFYNKLFQIMSKSNLMDRDEQGNQTNLFKVNADRAMVYPIVQMSGTRVKYVPQILYIYLSITPFSEGKKSNVQDRALKIIVSLPQQKQVKFLFEQCLEARQYIRDKILKDSEKGKL